ncbi:DUF4373 domain-containing protein [Dyadobacter diqingensis]|uniref:DUF4373 domain-containing protein n=1 Tax=Dyadobacter diqingensis TaxID=2938121 RepID=UPI0020C54122|nr:DUF4373 domain-containing protein [Dyadobacter diqingensis]
MAAPNKTGLDYFPFDVDFFEDEKLEAISGEFGLKGEMATVKLLCAVYKNGYFVVWNNLFQMKLLKRLPGITPELLEQIVNRLVLWGFFDKSLFDSAKVLTSKGIQSRYFEATKRRKSTLSLIYVINNEVNVDINPPTSNINANIYEQSKGEESKVNEIKQNEENEKEDFSSSSSPNVVPDFGTRERAKLARDLKIDPPELRAAPLTLDEYFEQMQKNQQLLETACMTRKVTPDQFFVSLHEFILEKKAIGHLPKSYQDIAQHYLNWLPIWKAKRDKQETEPVKGGKLRQQAHSIAAASEKIKSKGGYLTASDIDY